jgi:hypothetical protein
MMRKWEGKILSSVCTFHLFLLISWGGVRLSPLVRRPLPSLLYQPRAIDVDECEAVGGETEVLGENLPQCYIFPYESHINWLAVKPWLPQWKSGC